MTATQLCAPAEQFRLVGVHAHLPSPGDLDTAFRLAAEVFVENKADPAACAKAMEKLLKDELLSREEAMLYLIWEKAEEVAFREVTRGWLSRDVDIRLALAE